MEDKHICQNCKHFRQHYVKDALDRYSKCGSGHCVYPRCKPRYNDTKACQHYISKETQDIC